MLKRIKDFLQTLDTLIEEPKYIAAAVRGKPILPPNYWRIELCKFVLRRGSREELPNALRNNFCPLFWFTNLLAVLLPVILIVYTVVWFFFKCGDFLENFVGKPVEKWLAKLKSKRIANNIEAKKKDRLERSKFDPNATINPDFMLDKKRALELLLVSMRSHGELQGKVDITSPEVLDKILAADYYSFYDGDSAVTFATFVKHHGKNWRQELERLKREYPARLAEQEKKQAEKEAKIKARKDRINKAVMTVTAHAKPLFKGLAIFCLVPLALALAYGVYLLFAFTFGKLPAMANFMFVKHRQDLFAVSIFMLLLILLAINIKVAAESKWISRLFSKIIAKPVVRTAEFVGGVFLVTIIVPIAWVGSKFYKLFIFTRDIVKMFFSENCPHITWEDEVNEKAE